MQMDREVLRSAKLGSWSDAEAGRVVVAWRRSGESRAAFGRRSGIAVHRLYFWIAKLGGKRDGGATPGCSFSPRARGGRCGISRGADRDPVDQGPQWLG
jgi:hypothetical protein